MKQEKKMSVTIEPIPFFETNYTWLLYEEETKNALLVDPGDFTPIDSIIKDKHLNLQSLLITHHHSDHTGGLRQFKETYSCQVFAPMKERDRISEATHYVQDMEQISIGFAQFIVINTPGHTLGSICYYDANLKILFTGDTLFSLGCGRLFEGSPDQMFQSLQRIKSLPDDTLVYPAHEYTEDNGRFALSLAPNNLALQKRFEQVKQLRDAHKPTLPVLLETEKKLNPFLLAAIVEEFTRYRKAKDQF